MEIVVLMLRFITAIQGPRKIKIL